MMKTKSRLARVKLGSRPSQESSRFSVLDFDVTRRAVLLVFLIRIINKAVSYIYVIKRRLFLGNTRANGLRTSAFFREIS